MARRRLRVFNIQLRPVVCVLFRTFRWPHVETSQPKKKLPLLCIRLPPNNVKQPASKPSYTVCNVEFAVVYF
jgi:hypothetical protein